MSLNSINMHWNYFANWQTNKGPAGKGSLFASQETQNHVRPLVWRHVSADVSIAGRINDDDGDSDDTDYRHNNNWHTSSWRLWLKIPSCCSVWLLLFQKSFWIKKQYSCLIFTAIDSSRQKQPYDVILDHPRRVKHAWQFIHDSNWIDKKKKPAEENLF